MANLPAICVVQKILSSIITYMPAVKFIARLDRDPIGLFLDGHQPSADQTCHAIKGGFHIRLQDIRVNHAPNISLIIPSASDMAQLRIQIASPCYQIKT
jgi:hypothetical protein